MSIPEGVKKIAGQRVKPRVFVNGVRTGTEVLPAYGDSMGLKPKDFSAFRSIAGQKVTRPLSGSKAKSEKQIPCGNDKQVGGTGVRVGGRSSGATNAYTQIPISPQRASAPGTPFGNDKQSALASGDGDGEVIERETKRSAEETRQFLEAARARFQLAAEAESSVRRDSLDDLRFLVGDQWEDGIKRQRQMDGRPCLTINRLPQFVRQVTNEQRQNRPSVQVNPVGDGADEETAEILQGIVRHIEYESGADAAYDTAFFHAAACGFGYFRITTEYSDPMSFEQDIRIVRIRNPFTVYLDPSAKEPDYSDVQWGFIVETMSREAYKAAYPQSELSEMQDWQSIGDTGSDWIGQDQCRIAEYFHREYTKKAIVQLSDGSVVAKDELPDLLPEGVSVVNERETEIPVVRWSKINGVEVLEETEWAGKWIPIIKVIGDEFDVDGKIVLKGIVRDAKEPQQQYNFMKSASTEAIALAPKAPFVGAEGQFEGYEREWQQANTKSFAYLQYKAKALNGQPLPPPQRNVAEPAIQAINMAMMESADDLKAVTGIYDAALGAQGNEQSGKAILARQQQSQGSNFHYVDNLTRAIRHCGKILLDLIPKVYDTMRVIRIFGEEGNQKTVTVNEVVEMEGAMQKIYDLSVGKYDVMISTGPSYQSRRQEAVSSIISLTKSYPQLMGVAGDILVKNMDWPGAQEIAKRLHKTLPPQVVSDDSQVPPEAQQAVAQVQQLTQQLQASQNDLKNGISLKKMDLDSKERIAAGQQRIDELKIGVDQQRIRSSVLMTELKARAERGDLDAQRLFDYVSQLSAGGGDGATGALG